MLYAVIVVLILLLAVASCFALLLGVLGEVGVVHYARCQSCAHLVVSSRDTAAATCPYCRLQGLVHPLRALGHPLQRLIHH